jgi:hypothetical protein
VEWLSLRDAVFTAFTSTNAEVIHVNNYQRREFARIDALQETVV